MTVPVRTKNPTPPGLVRVHRDPERCARFRCRAAGLYDGRCADHRLDSARGA